MQTNRQLVSDILDNTKSLTLDDRISKRWVLSIAFDKATTLVKQEIDGRRLFEITSVWKPLHCIEMMKVNATVCGDLPNCKFLMKSRKKLPTLFESSYGDLIKVLTIDGSKVYNQTKPHLYRDILGRDVQDSGQRYFWILDGYLYIPDSEVHTVTAIGLFRNPQEVDAFNDVPPSCLSPLDEAFACPQYLIGIVKDQVEEEIVKIFKPLVEDSRPDDSTNQKR